MAGGTGYLFAGQHPAERPKQSVIPRSELAPFAPGIKRMSRYAAFEPYASYPPAVLPPDKCIHDIRTFTVDRDHLVIRKGSGNPSSLRVTPSGSLSLNVRTCFPYPLNSVQTAFERFSIPPMRFTLWIDFFTRRRSKSTAAASLITVSISFFAVTPFAVQITYTSFASAGSNS